MKSPISSEKQSKGRLKSLGTQLKLNFHRKTAHQRIRFEEHWNNRSYKHLGKEQSSKLSL